MKNLKTENVIGYVLFKRLQDLQPQLISTVVMATLSLPLEFKNQDLQYQCRWLLSRNVRKIYNISGKDRRMSTRFTMLMAQVK